MKRFNRVGLFVTNFSLIFGIVGCNLFKKKPEALKVQVEERVIDDGIVVFDPDQNLEIPELPKLETYKFRVAFYNCENLFDTIDGSNNDEEYLPTSWREWNSEKYISKLKNLARVIDSISPDVLGLCEVENKQVLEDLKGYSVWLTNSYAEICHFDSPDKRGIDVALIYAQDWAYYGGRGVSGSKGKHAEIDTIEVETGNPEKPTRSILAAHLYAYKPFTVFVNHWPSRSGGEERTRPLRANAAKALKTYIDNHPNIDRWVAVGDFNDNPTDSSLYHILEARDQNYEAINLAYIYRQANPELGTGKYRGNWDMFDQIIVSKKFYHIGPQNEIPQLQVYKRDWLLQLGGKYEGYPLRTFGGKNYLNGFSDHLPVYVDLEIY